MSFAAAGLAFFPALAIGSFLNVVAARVPLKRSVVSPPSACMSCGTELSWRDNIPVLSWLLLRGRCRTCKTEISWRYPAVELTTAVLVAACFWTFGFTADAGIAAFFCATLVVLSAIDIDRRIIPNNIVLPASVVVLVANTLVHPSVEWLAAGFGGALFLLLAALAYPRGMGMGDVKLAFVLGLFLGRDVGPALFVALVAGTLVGAAVIARKGAAEGRKTAVPFGPFLALGAVVALFAGDAMVQWYLSTFA
jgi:leader peptidase (prepilin peptidase) / N-methyltransferase